MVKTVFIVLCIFAFFPMSGLLAYSNIFIYGNNCVVANFNLVTSWITFDLKGLLLKKELPKGFEHALIKPISE